LGPRAVLCYRPSQTPAAGHRVRISQTQPNLYGPRASAALHSSSHELVGTCRSNQEALTGTSHGLLPFEVKIPALHNRSEVALHQLSGDFSEQTALHHIEIQLAWVTFSAS
jgi:hypothetical protein